MNGHSSESRHRKYPHFRLSIGPAKFRLQSSGQVPDHASDRHRDAKQGTVRTPSYDSACNNRRPQAAQRALEIDIDADLRRQALKEAKQGNHGKAIAIFSDLITRNPASASDYNNRGLVYFQATQFDEAIADYNRAIELNPHLDSVYNNRANYYACRGQLQQAIQDYSTAIDLNPCNVRAWINRGITHRELHEYGQAIECFDTALTFRRLEGHIYAERGRAYHLWGEWNIAVADYERAIAELPFSTCSLFTSAGRLRLQVELWLDDLLAPLSESFEEFE